MAKQKNKRWSDYLWIVSATYFTLGFFNIIFAWLGVICFLIPLLIAVFNVRLMFSFPISVFNKVYCPLDCK